MALSRQDLPVVVEEISYPDLDYTALRRSYQAPQVVIPYKPAEEPAWSKHSRALPPKPARFEKLNQWTTHAERIKVAAQLAILAAGAATMAPAVIRLVH